MTKVQSSKAVADEIYRQLGGPKIIGMLGAKNFSYGTNALSFWIGRGAKKGINRIKITLNKNDEYDVEFAKMRGLDYNVLETAKNIQVSKLKDTIRQHTGMELSL